jgi:hypothetical protein
VRAHRAPKCAAHRVRSPVQGLQTSGEEIPMQQRQYYDTTAPRLATGLGWFSVALGCSEVLFPRQIARLIGAPETAGTFATLQGYGAREIANGLAILAEPDRPAWLWGRVAGDVLDLATLASFMGSPRSDRTRTTLASIAVLGVTGLDLFCARRADGNGQTGISGAADMPREEAITINATADRLREAWRNRDQLPHALREHTLDGEDRTVRFRVAPGGRATEMRVRLSHGGSRGVIDRAAGLVGRDEVSLLRDALRQLKQIVETGEIVRSEGPALWRASQPTPAAVSSGQGGR